MTDEKDRKSDTPEGEELEDRRESPSDAPDYLEEPGPQLDMEPVPDEDVDSQADSRDSDSTDVDTVDIESRESGEDSYSRDFEGETSEDKLLQCKARVRQLEAEIHSLKETLLRKMAEFENLKKRTIREKDEAIRYGTADILTNLLEVLDNFDRALAVEPDAVDMHSFYEGMKLVARHLQEILRGQGLAEVDPAGEPFDPFFHEAMMRHETDEVPDNTVLEVFQKGYKLKDRLLRPARVMVATRPAGSATGAEEPSPAPTEEDDE